MSYTVLRGATVHNHVKCVCLFVKQHVSVGEYGIIRVLNLSRPIDEETTCHKHSNHHGSWREHNATHCIHECEEHGEKWMQAGGRIALVMVVPDSTKDVDSGSVILHTWGDRSKWWGLKDRFG